jgi:hypothetical protein
MGDMVRLLIAFLSFALTLAAADVVVLDLSKPVESVGSGVNFVWRNVSASAATPVYSDSLTAMWTFNAANWTQAVYGVGGLTRSAGQAVYVGDGTISLTGLTSYAITPLSTVVSNTGTIVIRAATVSTATQYYYWLGSGFAANDQRMRYVSGGHEFAAYAGSAAQWGPSTIAHSTGTYAIVAITWAANDMRVYRLASGASVVTQIMADTSCALTWVPTAAWLWSYTGAGQNSFVGTFDEFRIYNRVMSSNECLAIIADMPWTQ